MRRLRARRFNARCFPRAVAILLGESARSAGEVRAQPHRAKQRESSVNVHSPPIN